MPDIPAWLQKFLGLDAEKLKALGVEAADLEAARTGYAATAGLAATVEKIRARYPDLNIEEAVEVAQKYQDWRSTSWPEFERRYNAMVAENEALRRRPAAETPAATPSADSRSYPISQDDLWETARLQAALAKIDDQIGERVYSRVTKDWWEKEIAPRWQKTADQYMDINLRLFRALWPKVYGTEAPDLDTLLRESAARGERDFGKLLGTLTDSTATTKKAGYDEGYKAAEAKYKAELEKHTPAPTPAATGPTGQSMPAWKPAPEAKGAANGTDLKARVLDTVAKKYGGQLAV